jgi:hypothetical protein
MESEQGKTEEQPPQEQPQPTQEQKQPEPTTEVLQASTEPQTNTNELTQEKKDTSKYILFFILLFLYN